MTYQARPTWLFLRQLENLGSVAKRQLSKKVELVEQNPIRSKGITSYGRSLYRIRFQDLGKEKRAVYSVEPPYVVMLCILDRAKDYKDLRKYLKILDYH